MSEVRQYMVWPRQAGKTLRLAEWLAAAPDKVARVLIVPTREERKRFLDQFQEKYELEEWQVTTAHEARGGTATITHRMAGYGHDHIEYAIDGLDQILGSIFPGIMVKVAAATGANHEPKNYPLTYTP